MTEQPAPPRRQLQRVAVLVVPGPGRPVVAGWLGHGEAPRDAVRRLVPTFPGTDGGDDGGEEDREGDGEDGAPRVALSDVVRIGEPDAVMHVLALGYAAPGATPPGPGLPDALLEQSPPDDHVDHLEGDRLAEADLAAAAVAGKQPPIKVQRAGAYALLLRDGVRDGRPLPQVLLARLAYSGRWTMPGGGIDFGEHPETAVRREVHEETGLTLDAVRLLDVGDAHWTGRAPNGRLEDFHAVQVLYAATVAGDVDADHAPSVVEVGGSTDHVEWLDLTDLAGRRVSHAVLLALRHVPGLPPGLVDALRER